MGWLTPIVGLAAAAILGSGCRERAQAVQGEAELRDMVRRMMPLVAEAATLARLGRVSLEAEPAHEPAEEEPNPFGLTDRELEVLRLIATGQTNREIGDTLYMSPKTASAHVSRILSKLGVSGRVEAAAAAHRMALSGDDG